MTKPILSLNLSVFDGENLSRMEIRIMVQLKYLIMPMVLLVSVKILIGVPLIPSHPTPRSFVSVFHVAFFCYIFFICCFAEPSLLNEVFILLHFTNRFSSSDELDLVLYEGVYVGQKN